MESLAVRRSQHMGMARPCDAIGCFDNGIEFAEIHARLYG
jgi:hypothetical protein